MQFKTERYKISQNKQHRSQNRPGGPQRLHSSPTAQPVWWLLVLPLSELELSRRDVLSSSVFDLLYRAFR